MPTAEIITIGTELLLGEIQDTNTRYLARHLRDHGVNLYRTMTVGDNAHRIAQAIREALTRAEIVITTGGLGPTVDDPTRQAVAEAVDTTLEFQPVLWDQIQDRFKRFNRTATENNKRQAFIPKSAIPVENPVGTAPAFICEVGERCVISLPGVPREMEHLFQNRVLPYLQQRYDLHGTIKARVLHVSGEGESVIDEQIGDLEELTNPTVGLAAHAGQIDIRITAKADTQDAAQALILPVETEIRARLGRKIYGVDEEQLEEVALQAVAARGLSLITVEYGLGGGLVQRLSQTKLDGQMGNPFQRGEILAELAPADASMREQLVEQVRQWQAGRPDTAVILASLTPQGERQELYAVWCAPGQLTEAQRYYGGPPLMAPLWAINNVLDFVRKSVENLS